MSKWREKFANMNGLPTALLYVGCFPLVGCLAVALPALLGWGFVAVWMRVCDGAGLSAVLPVRGVRLLLGALLYLALAVPICRKLWKAGDSPTPSPAVSADAAGGAGPPGTAPPDAPPPADQMPTEAAAGTATLRFDGVYYSQTYTAFGDQDYDPVAHKYRKRRYFFRFYPDGTAAQLYDDGPLDEAFARLAPQDGTPAGLAYTLSDRYLEIKSDTRTEYYGSVTDDTLDLVYDDDSYMGYTQRPFHFQRTA